MVHPEAMGAAQQFHWASKKFGLHYLPFVSNLLLAPFGQPSTLPQQAYRPSRPEEPVQDQKVIDQLYQQLVGESATNGDDLDQPAGLASRLLPYQKQV